MQVRLNAWRGEDGPGTVVDLDERDARAMLLHGTAHAVDQPAEQPPPPAGRAKAGSGDDGTP